MDLLFPSFLFQGDVFKNRRGSPVLPSSQLSGIGFPSSGVQGPFNHWPPCISAQTEREAGCPGAQCPAVSTPALPPGSGFESLVPRVKIREKEGGLNLGPGCSQGPSPAPGAVTGNHQVPADKEPVVQSSAPAAGVSSLPHLGSVSVGSWGEGTGVGARGRGQRLAWMGVSVS